MTRIGQSVGALLLLVFCACPPTLSSPSSDPFEGALAHASRAELHGRDEEARAAYRDAARLARRDVDREEAMYREARSFMREDKVEEALVLLDDLVARHAQRRYVRALLDGGTLRTESGQRGQGVAALRKVVREHPSEGVAGSALAALIRDRRAHPEDGTVLGLLGELDAEGLHGDVGDDVLMAIHDEQKAAGDLASARTALERIIHEHRYPFGERWDDAHWKLADLSEDANDPRGAIAALERMLAPHESVGWPGSYTLPRYSAAQLRIARIYRDSLNNISAALAAYDAVPARFPTSLVRDDAMFEAAELQLRAGNRDDGCNRLSRVIRDFEVGSARRRAVELHAQRCQ